MTELDVPSDAVWLPVLDVRMRDSVPELYETGSNYTMVICKTCGAKKKIVTDQELV